MNLQLIMFVLGDKMGVYSIEYKNEEQYGEFVSYCYNDYLKQHGIDHSPDVVMVKLSDHPVVKGFVLDKLKANLCLN